MGFKKIHYDRDKNIQKWKICIDDPFPNCDRIFPIQQKKVERLIRLLSSDANISKIVIFGSSVTERCHMGSDIDAYIIQKRDKTIPMRELGSGYDIWTNHTVDARLLAEITKKGVTVYDRKQPTGKSHS